MLINEKDLKFHFDGDEELIGELIDVFDSSYPGTLASIKTSLDTKNFTDLELHAHTLKGMIANFFAEELKAAALELELMGRDKKDIDGSEYFEILLKKLPNLVSEVKSIL